MSASDVDSEVQALSGLNLEGLRAAWRARYGAPPKLRSPELLGFMLAWRMQAAALGGLDADTRRALRRPVGEKPRPKVTGGSRLVREWDGVRHEVTVLNDGGFEYRGERHRSLSEIARLITGTRWNGPRFFGLRGAKS